MQTQTQPPTRSRAVSDEVVVASREAVEEAAELFVKHFRRAIRELGDR